MVVTLDSFNQWAKAIMLLGGVAAGTGAVWKFWIEPLGSRLNRFFTQHEHLVQILTTEFETADGRVSLLDAIRLALVTDAEFRAKENELKAWQLEHDRLWPRGHEVTIHAEMVVPTALPPQQEDTHAN